VRAYLVTHATGVILIDTGMDASGHALDAALGEASAAWSDVSHVLISHAHRDHVGALEHCGKQLRQQQSWLAAHFIDFIPKINTDLLTGACFALMAILLASGVSLPLSYR
jgi:glyoxylase-like metal-dependent hydrolase (beta-lactamase superfamily II)